MNIIDIICDEKHRSKLDVIKSKSISDFQLNYHSCMECKDNPDFVQGFNVEKIKW